MLRLEFVFCFVVAVVGGGIGVVCVSVGVVGIVGRSASSLL